MRLDCITPDEAAGAWEVPFSSTKVACHLSLPKAQPDGREALLPFLGLFRNDKGSPRNRLESPRGSLLSQNRSLQNEVRTIPD